MHQFNPIDAALLLFESTRTPFHVSMTYVYDPSTCPGKRPTFEDIIEAVRISLPVAPPFRRKIVRVPLDVDYPYWVEDDDFDLDFHMRNLALPKPGNWKQFQTQVSRLVSRPLDLTRPPWEITIIEGLDAIEGLAPGCFALVLKIHHCAIDGTAGVAMLNALHTDSPRKKIRKQEDHWQPEAMPTNKWLLRHAWINSVRHPVAIARLLLSNARALLKAAVSDQKNDNDEDDLEVPVIRLNAPISAHRIFDDVRCSLDDMKRVRRTVEGATVNDVCISVVAESMRRYLDSKGELPKQSLVIMVPISTRTPDQVDKAGGNLIALTRVSMHTDIEDPIERLEAITAETRQKKAMQKGVVMSVLLDVVHELPGALIGTTWRAITPLIAVGSSRFGVCNTMLSNVPGPQDPIYFLGAKNVLQTGTSPLMDGGGLMHCVGSYMGQMLFTFTACPDLLPDHDFYRDTLEQSIKHVISVADARLGKRQKSAGSKSGSRPARKKRPVKS